MVGDGDAGGEGISGSRSFQDQAQDFSAIAKARSTARIFQRLFLYHVTYERFHNLASEKDSSLPSSQRILESHPICDYRGH